MAERMIERLCRVMCLAWGIDPDSTSGGTYDAGCLPKGQPAWTIWEDQVRALLEEMREPTRGMLHAAAKAMSPGRRPTPEHVSCREKHRIRYAAMIDEALNSAEAERALR